MYNYILLLNQMSHNEELMTIIEKEIKQLKKRVNAVKKLKGDQRLQQADKLKRGDLKRLANYLTSFQVTLTAIDQNVDQQIQRAQKAKLEEYRQDVELLRKTLYYTRNQGLKQEQIFRERIDVPSTDRNQLIDECNRAQVNSEEGVRRILRNLYEMKEIGNTVNVQLQAQIQKLDSIYEELQQTESTMKRALRHISYFARAVYTDKLLITLIGLIVIAVIVIIVLSAMGKIPGQNQDILP